MIPPSSGISEELEEYERKLRAERTVGLTSPLTREAAEQEIEALLVARQIELMSASDRHSSFAAWW